MEDNVALNPAPEIMPISETYQKPNNSRDFNSLPHKGIFQPYPNILICKTHCCCKFLGLYIILIGSIFGTVFTTIGIIEKMIISTIAGIFFFSVLFISGISLFCSIIIEVHLAFSNTSVEIIELSVCREKRQIVHKDEIANIIFEYNEGQEGGHQTLYIMFSNGTNNNYFGSNCFTKEEIEYFNNEVKRLLGK